MGAWLSDEVRVVAYLCSKRKALECLGGKQWMRPFLQATGGSDSRAPYHSAACRVPPQRCLHTEMIVCRLLGRESSPLCLQDSHLETGAKNSTPKREEAEKAARSIHALGLVAALKD